MRHIDQLSLAVFICTLLLVLMFTLHTTSCQSGMAQGSPQQGPQQKPSPFNSGFWYSASNLGTLTTTPTSMIQPAPQLSQTGSYMLFANASLQAAPGGYPTITCYIQVGSANFPASITSPQPGLAENLTATGATTLSSANIPASVSLVCSSNQNGGQVSVLEATISIIRLETLQTGS